MTPQQLESKLTRFLELLSLYNEEHWYQFFLEAKSSLDSGDTFGALRKIRSAYGGMGSINDALYFTGAPTKIAIEGFTLRDELSELSRWH